MDSIASFTRQLEDITSPCSPLIGQYPHHMTLLPSSFYGERCYGIYPYEGAQVPQLLSLPKIKTQVNKVRVSLHKIMRFTVEVQTTWLSRTFKMRVTKRDQSCSGGRRGEQTSVYQLLWTYPTGLLWSLGIYSLCMRYMDGSMCSASVLSASHRRCNTPGGQRDE